MAKVKREDSPPESASAALAMLTNTPTNADMPGNSHRPKRQRPNGLVAGQSGEEIGLDAPQQMADRNTLEADANDATNAEATADNPLMKPHPIRITAEDWEQANAHWLDKLHEVEATKDVFGPIMDQKVTKEIMPIISNQRRHLLDIWSLAEGYTFQEGLSQIPFQTDVELPYAKYQKDFKTETDAARRSIRTIEAAALSLPKSQEKTARLIKQHTDRLFFYQDKEMKRLDSMRGYELEARQQTDLATTSGDTNPDPEAPGLTEGDMIVLRFLETRHQMTKDEFTDWLGIAHGICRTAKEEGHPINEAEFDECNNREWLLLLRLARQRAGKLLVTLMEWERCHPDPN